MTDLFLRLTPDWVLKAVEAAGLEPTGHLTALNCLENRVYDLRLEDGSHVVAKFYRPARWSRSEILEEHAFLAELAEQEIPVIAPRRFEDGETLKMVEGIQYAVWPRIGGRSPDELNDEQVDMLGRLLARIHNVGAGRPARARPRLCGNSFVREPLRELESSGTLSPTWASRYRKAAESLAALYDDQSRGVPCHRIHGDCHFGNLLHGREGWFFLDFDDFLTGPAVQDVWMLIPGRDEEANRMRQRFVEAYQQFRPFEQAWLRLVEPLRALRFIRYAAWVARRFNDPAFPAAFPHFGTEQYWERETLDLERQLRAVQGAVYEV